MIVRSGAIDPWGNIALQSGVDYPAYFANGEIGRPDAIRALIDRPPFVPGGDRQG